MTHEGVAVEFSPEDGFVHAPSGMVFPARLGAQVLTECRRYDESGLNVSVSYEVAAAGAPEDAPPVQVLTAYVYPAPVSPGGESFLREVHENTAAAIRSCYPGCHLDETLPVDDEGEPCAAEAAVGYRSTFRDIRVGWAEGPMASHLYLFEHAGWFFKIRVTSRPGNEGLMSLAASRTLSWLDVPGAGPGPHALLPGAHAEDEGDGVAAAEDASSPTAAGRPDPSDPRLQGPTPPVAGSAAEAAWRITATPEEIEAALGEPFLQLLRACPSYRRRLDEVIRTQPEDVSHMAATIDLSVHVVDLMQMGEVQRVKFVLDEVEMAEEALRERGAGTLANTFIEPLYAVLVARRLSPDSMMPLLGPLSRMTWQITEQTLGRVPHEQYRLFDIFEDCRRRRQRNKREAVPSERAVRKEKEIRKESETQG